MRAMLLPLEWDSTFFGFPIYKLDLSSVIDRSIDIAKLLPQNAGRGCVYVTTMHNTLPEMVEQLEQLGAVHYGSRVVFHASVGQRDAYFCASHLKRKNVSVCCRPGFQAKIQGFVRKMA